MIELIDRPCVLCPSTTAANRRSNIADQNLGSDHAERSYWNYFVDIGMARLPSKSEVTEGGQTLELANYTYDGWFAAPFCGNNPLTDVPNLTYHDGYFGTAYSPRGLVTYAKALGKPASCISYDIGGNVVKSRDLEGHQTEFSITSASQWTAPSTVTPNSESNLASSLQWGQYLSLSLATGPNGATSIFTYDGVARPASTTSPHGAVTTYTYNDTATPPYKTATTNGKWVKTTMDGLGRTIKTESGYGSTTVSTVETEYGPCACSPMGKVKRVSMPYAPGGTVNWTEYEYDARGRTTKVTPPGNAGFTSYVYEGNTVKVTDPAGKWKKHTLDALGRLVQVTEPRPGVSGSTDDTFYSYNSFDKLTQVSMTRGSTTQLRTFVYDSSMRLQSVTQPENGTTSYTYDSLDRIATKTDAKGQVITYSYDAYGRILSDGKATYTYDTGTGANLWGRLASVTSSAGVETFSYTQSGLIASKTQANTAFISPAPNVEYLYDNEGKVTQLTYPQTGVPKAGGGYDPVARRVLTYHYDSAGRPLKVMEGAMEIAGSAQYNAAGQLTAYNANGARSFQYNLRGQMTWVTESGVNVEYRYSLTANDGRVWQRKDWISGEEVTYLYDELGRLSSAATTGPEWGLSWSIDGFGNRLAQNVTKGTAPVVSLTVNPATNRITSSGFQYDANGNQTQWTQGLDTITAAYDVANRMTSVTSPSYVEVYKYNAANQRLVKDNQWGTQRRHYVYGLGGELLGEYEECSTGGSWYVPCNKKERIYFAGRFVQEEGVWKGTDRLGTVGQTAARAYPYGEANSEFATYRRDTLSGLDYAWNRYYSSTWGRFLSADPYQQSAGLTHPQSWNRYSYVANDPANYHDPQGLQQKGPPSVVTPPMNVVEWISPLETMMGLYSADNWWDPSFGGRPTAPAGGDLSNLGATFSVTATCPPRCGDQIYGLLGLGADILSDVYDATQPLTQVSTWTTLSGASMLVGTGYGAYLTLDIAAPTTLGIGTGLSGFSAQLLESFQNGQAEFSYLARDLAVSRVFDNIQSFAQGNFYTTSGITSSAQATQLLALGPWNQATHVVNAVIPAGTPILSGLAAPFAGQPGLGSQIVNVNFNGFVTFISSGTLP